MLDINPPERDTVHATMRMEDLDDDYEGSKFNNYEKKIDSLMSEVGSLKTEVCGKYIIDLLLFVTKPI